MALPFIPVTPEEAARNIATKMSFVREGVRRKGEYLADSEITEKVYWEPYGSGHKLALLPPTSHSPTTNEAAPSSGDPKVASSPVSGNSTDVTAEATSTNDVPADPPPPATPAILTIIAQLVPGQSWLYPDGRWTGPTQYVRRFTDIKLVCTGGAPTHSEFADDYTAAIANLNEIMGRIEDSRNNRNTVICGSGNHIRIRHALFRVRTT